MFYKLFIKLFTVYLHAFYRYCTAFIPTRDRREAGHLGARSHPTAPHPQVTSHHARQRSGLGVLFTLRQIRQKRTFTVLCDFHRLTTYTGALRAAPRRASHRSCHR